MNDNFRELSALSERREKCMDSRLRELKEGAQLYANLNREKTVLSRSIFAKDKKKYKMLKEGSEYKKAWKQFQQYCKYI